MGCGFHLVACLKETATVRCREVVEFRPRRHILFLCDLLLYCLAMYEV
jgi:hypothetical protein